MKKWILVASLGMITLVACKKDDEMVVKEKTTSEKIVGMWKFTNALYSGSFNGMADKDTIIGKPADFLNFKTNGKLVTFVDGELDSANYSITTDNKVAIAGDAIYDIKTLNTTNFTLFARENGPGATDFDEITINLRK